MMLAAMVVQSLGTADTVIDRLRRGDPDALSEVIAQYHHRLYRFLARLVQDDGLAEDLFQQTWIRVIEKVRQYDARRSFDAWLFAVARNLAIDVLRRRRDGSLDAPDASGHPLADHLTAAGPDPLEQALDSERGAVLAAALAELPAIHREVLTLRFEEDMKLDEIAEVAGIPLSTVKSRLHRALAGLRTVLERS
jgi:RNA polymerase sigma-70 factor, ECF subfamily